jgi:uncharacterized protein (TIGR02611 family)
MNEKDPRMQTGMHFWEGKSLRSAKKFLVAIIGFTLLIVGTAMILLPGPALIVIPLGLAILATEFHWARRVMKRLKKILEGRRQKNQSLKGL